MNNEQIQKLTPVKIQRELSIGSDLVQGWLEVPKQGNVKKYGWVIKYCVLDADRFAIFENETNAQGGVPEYVFASMLDSRVSLFSKPTFSSLFILSAYFCNSTCLV